LNDLPNSTHW